VNPIDESEYIQRGARGLRRGSYEVRPTSERFFTEVEDFIWHVEEPTVSTGPYAQWCVQREAREQVTVLLDGQGGTSCWRLRGLTSSSTCANC